jgi:thiamine transport system substrate-binding protein
MNKSALRFALLSLTVVALAAWAAAPTPPGQSLAPALGRGSGAPPVQATTAATSASTLAPTAESPTETATPTLAPGQTELVLMTHSSFAASEDVIAEFEKANNARLRILKAGDAGEALNKAILSKNNPLGDVFFGVDNTFLSRALKADLFVPYQARNLDTIPASFRLDAQNRVTPIDYGDVCLNYDKAWFKKKSLTPPATLEDLAQGQYKSLLAVENPATSSPGLAFLLATIAHFGEDKYLDYWKQLRANDVLVSEGWEDAYYNKSTWAGKGDRPIVVSYATSPAAEVFFSNGQLTEPPTGNVLGDDTCFRQIEFAGLFKGAKHPELAQKFVDFLISPRFQEDVPLQMFVYPVLPGTKLPDFYKFAEQPKKPATLTADQIDANRDKWINAWTTAVLR